MKRSRIVPAVAGLALCAVAFAIAWPHARDGYAILAAQDDPGQLADLQLHSSLRNNEALITDNIEAAIAANDADLADSFVGLARDRNIPLGDELRKRVRSEEHTSELQSQSHISYAVFCLKKKKK